MHRVHGRFVFSASAVLLASALIAACGGLNGNKVIADGDAGAGGSGGTGNSPGSAGTTATEAGTTSGGTHTGGNTSAGGKGGAAPGGSENGGNSGATGTNGGNGGTLNVAGTSGSAGNSSGKGGSAGAGVSAAGNNGNAGTGGAAAGNGGAGGGSGCNNIVQQGDNVSVTNSNAAVPAQTRGVIVPGTYVLVSEDMYIGNSTFSVPPSTLTVTSVHNSDGTSDATVNLLNAYVLDGTFTFRMSLPANSALAPTGTTITCTSNPILSAGGTLPLDYSATATTLRLAYLTPYNSVANYTLKP